MESGVPQLIRRLVECLVTQCEKDDASNPRDLLVFPAHAHKPYFSNKDSVLKHLYRTAYDLLLLRRREWYGRRASELSPECQCLAMTYVLREMGRVADSKRLDKAICTMMETVSEPQSVCQLLALLATESSPQISRSFCQLSSKENSYPYFPNSLFAEPPGTSMRWLMNAGDMNSAKVMKMVPGSGFSSFCSQKELTKEFCPVPSTLFHGLTHTDTASINVRLQVPPLSSQPSDLLQRLLHQKSIIVKEKSLDLDISDDRSTAASDFISLIDSVGSLDEPKEPHSWEGPVQSTMPKYLSVAGGEAFCHSQRVYAGTLAWMARTECPDLITNLKHVSSSTRSLYLCLDSRTGFDKGLDEIQQSFGLAVQNLVRYCCVMVDQHTELGTSQLTQQSSLNGLLPVMQFASQQVQHSAGLSKGLYLLGELYQCCMETQGLPSYPLFLGLFKQSLGPYLRFLDNWVFRGNPTLSDAFGLLVNDECLSRRDYTYWLEGFRLDDGGVPKFLSAHANLILDTGKVLNFLRLCCPKHHLCSGDHPLPRLSLSLSLSELATNQSRYEEYRQQMEGLAIEMTQRKHAKKLEKELSFMAPFIQARQEARTMMALLKERERSLLAQEEEKKRVLMVELKEGMERARALRAEEREEERERDREMMAALSQMDHESTSREQMLKQEAREAMEAHYQQLTEQAELRTLRAQWRAKRMSLGMQRLHQMEQEAERYHNELRSKPELNFMHVSKIRHGRDSMMAEHLEVLDVESPVAEDMYSGSSDNRGSTSEPMSSEPQEVAGNEGTLAVKLIAPPPVSHKVLDGMESLDKTTTTGPVNGLMKQVLREKGKPCRTKEILHSSIGSAEENLKSSRSFESSSVMQDIFNRGREECQSESTSDLADHAAGTREQPLCKSEDIVCNGTDDIHTVVTKSAKGHGFEPESVMQNIIYGGYEKPSGAREAIGKAHKLPSQVKEILYGGFDDTVKERLTSHNFKPDSVMQDILYGGWDQPGRRFTSTPEEARLAPAAPLTTRGMPPLSVVQELLYPDADRSVEEKREVDRTRENEDADGNELAQARTEGIGEGESKQRSACSSQETSLSNGVPNSPHRAVPTKAQPPSPGKMVEPKARPYSHFQDDFSILSQPPFTSTRLLMFAGPPDAKHDSPSCSSLCPLQVLVDRCIVRPILIQARLVNSAIVEHFLADLKLKEHFAAIKRYLLMEDGEFARGLSSQLFHQLMYGHSLERLCSASFLNPLLSMAIECSLSRDSQYTECLSLGLVYHPRNIVKSSIDALDFLQLTYKVEWPYNIVIHADSINKYNTVFQFLLKIKRASWALTKVCHVLNKGDIRKWMSDMQLRMVHAQKQELQHFVAVMEGYITNQLFHLSWQELVTRFKEVKSLDELIQCHNKFLDSIMFRCLLSRNPEKGVMKVIRSILSYIMTFSTQLLVGHPNMTVLSKLRKSFTEASKILLKVAVTLAEKGFQPHLEEFILRLNYNRFYQA